MKFIKKNKYTIVIIIIFVLILIGVAELKNVLVPDEGRAVYGHRLDLTSEHNIDNTTFDEIERSLKENNQIKDFSKTIHGKIINLIITVSDDVSINNAKTIANSTINFFKNDELKYYSLNVFVKKENQELNNFPIEGYKHPESDKLVFTKDREIIKGDENEEEK